MSKMSDVSDQEMISGIDQDGNSQINFNEFVWLMTRLVSASKRHYRVFRTNCFLERFMIRKLKMRLEMLLLSSTRRDTALSVLQVTKIPGETKYEVSNVQISPMSCKVLERN